jgi:hypothetical protein
MKRYPCGFILLLAGITLVIVGLCGWFTIKPILGTCVDTWPESLNNPPVMPNAEQVEFGKSSYEPREGYIGKLTQFQISGSPNDTYTFYLTTLGQDGWFEDPNQQVMPNPNLAEAKFNWQCTTMSSHQQIASLWLHAEVIPSGKTVVTLNYDYATR